MIEIGKEQREIKKADHWCLSPLSWSSGNWMKKSKNCSWRRLMRPYILKRKDKDIAVINITEEGAITDYRMIEENSRFAPLHDKGSTDWLKSVVEEKSGSN